MSDYNINDLLKILGEEGATEAPSCPSEIEKFIANFNIRNSKDIRIPNYIIYYTYKEVFGGTMSKIHFFREFKKKYEQKRVGKQRRYAISGKFDLSREGLIRAEYFEKGLNE